MKQNILLLAIVVLLMIYPLAFVKNAEFGGADEQISGTISEVKPDYEPWFTVIWEPPSGEVESLLFAVQASLGAGFLGYFFGYYKGKMSGKVRI